MFVVLLLPLNFAYVRTVHIYFTCFKLSNMQIV